MLKHEHYITTHFYCYKTGQFYQVMPVPRIISHDDCCSKTVYSRNVESLFFCGNPSPTPGLDNLRLQTATLTPALRKPGLQLQLCAPKSDSDSGTYCVT